jgi:hypothetical protein
MGQQMVAVLEAVEGRGRLVGILWVQVRNSVGPGDEDISLLHDG